jgi:protease I
MSSTLQGQTVAFLTAQEGVEEVEHTKPLKAVQEAGGSAWTRT